MTMMRAVLLLTCSNLAAGFLLWLYWRQREENRKLVEVIAETVLRSEPPEVEAARLSASAPPGWSNGASFHAMERGSREKG